MKWHQCDQFRYTSPAFDSISTSSGSEGGEPWRSSDPSDLSPSWKPLRAEKLHSEIRFTSHDVTLHRLTRQRGEPPISFLRLDYDYEHENEREFVIRASSFPNLCSLLPAPGSLMPAAWAFVLGLLLLVGLRRGLPLGVSRRALRLMRHYLRLP